jgi:multidrug efflux pump subunit AcrA (membrane-fusion protein)
VRRRHVTLGQYVRAGDAIAEIVDRSRLLVRFRVSEAESAPRPRHEGRRPRAALDALDHPATLVHVDETASATTRMVECLAELANATPTLKPGFYAVASVETRTARALRAQSALQPTERGWVGFVVVDGKARARLLTLGLRTKDARVEVLTGLAEGGRSSRRARTSSRKAHRSPRRREAAGEGGPARAPAPPRRPDLPRGRAPPPRSATAPVPGAGRE